ncbi:ABC transporter substrate-binding protein [Deinococcus petrolearius]|uniref:ABC transporter substrate-binding protein n=1 Tax=Deinococcus petrolearius TaxID=1751295 RepID=A0ABW1DGJ4_9DEIO
MNKTARFAPLCALLVLGSGVSSVAQAQGKGSVTFLSGQQAETEGATGVINSLSKAYQKTHSGFGYQIQIQSTDLAQKLQLLAASGSLPTLFSIDQPTLLQQLAARGQVVDLQQAFEKLGIYNKLNPVAVQLNKKVAGGKLVSLPLELNIEGFWYNKALFKKYGVKEPQTWDDLVRAAETFQKNGVQPFAASGQQKWPLTRLIGGYVARRYGPDAMDRVKAGTLKVTDPGFVEAVSAVQDLGKKGYFGKGVNTVDYQTAVDTFLQGRAAMFYMGSWALSNFNDKAQNKIGAQNVGFINFPTVKGGRGTLNDWSINTGMGASLNAKQYDGAADWVKYVFSNYGDRALAEQGLLTGFKVTKTPANLPALTKLVQQKLTTAKNGYLWFEGYFSPKATAVATDNVQPLVTGDLSPQDYLQQLQAALR